MNFYTLILRKSGNYWIALCIENGIVGQGDSKEDAIRKLKEAVVSVEDALKTESDVYCAPIAMKELHEFLTI
jgi:predicted RNase H-like HicB family nuclease